jgi:hypothetical protein
MTTCRACQAPIHFVRTGRGKAMPLDATPVRRGGKPVLWRLDGTQAMPDADGMTTGHESHFASCPSAAVFRRPSR